VIVLWHYNPSPTPSKNRWAEWGIPAAFIVAAVALGSRRPAEMSFQKKAAKYLGDASYSIYMLHILVLTEVVRFAQGRGLGGIAAGAVLALGCSVTIALSLLTYNFFERPVMRLLNIHWRNSKQRGHLEQIVVDG
jgi:exopolysaccharide production protein ExoZ